MKMYQLEIRDKNGHTEFLNSWHRINLGNVIGWGPDNEAPDGIMRWTVIRVKEYPT